MAQLILFQKIPVQLQAEPPRKYREQPRRGGIRIQILWETVDRFLQISIHGRKHGEIPVQELPFVLIYRRKGAQKIISRNIDLQIMDARRACARQFKPEPKPLPCLAIKQYVAGVGKPCAAKRLEQPGLPADGLFRAEQEFIHREDPSAVLDFALV